MIENTIKWAFGCAIMGLATFVSVSSSHATGSIDCVATDDSGASISIGIGRLPVLVIISAFVTAEGLDWTLDGRAGTQISVGQAFNDNDRVLVDFVDTNIEEILISLRLHRGMTGKSVAEGGVLVVHNVGTYPVKCEEG